MYRLKNKELQETLSKTFVDFDKQFKYCCNAQWSDATDCVIVRLHSSPDISNIMFCKDAIEEVAEYNPKAWNEYPSVTPPEGIVMRVEGGLLEESCSIRSSAVFIDGEWRGRVDSKEPSVINTLIHRFRPWEDD